MVTTSHHPVIDYILVTACSVVFYSFHITWQLNQYVRALFRQKGTILNSPRCSALVSVMIIERDTSRRSVSGLWWQVYHYRESAKLEARLEFCTLPGAVQSGKISSNQSRRMKSYTHADNCLLRCIGRVSKAPVHCGIQGCEDHL